MSQVDQLTRAFWKFSGRPIDLVNEHGWLSSVRSMRSEVGEAWLVNAAAEIGGSLLEGEADAGLLRDMAELNGPDFDAAELRPQVRDFYEHTSRWRLEVWNQWGSLFQPAGRFLAQYFGRRVKQLSIPTRPLEVALGMDSSIKVIADADGRQVAAAWVRRLRSTGEFIYSGHYRVQRLPGYAQPSVNVAFPLESGNVQVFLRPRVGRGGSLLLSSSTGEFGQEGTYMVVQDSAGDFHAARVPLHEAFRVYVDDEGTLRTDHIIRMGKVTVVQLHYRMEKKSEDTSLSDARLP